MTTIAAAAAEEAFDCPRCGHTIHADQKPVTDASGQIACCEGDATRLSYQVRVVSRALFPAQRTVECAWCANPIAAGDEVLRVSVLLEDVEQPDEVVRRAGEGLTAGLNTPAPKPASFDGLGAKMRQKFSWAGLGNGRGARTPHEAEQFFRDSVPGPVRNMGPKAVEEFVKGKDASHIESVANAPGKAKSAGNIVWEVSGRNLRRGSRNMSRPDRLLLRVKNGVDAAGIVAKKMAASAARGAVLGGSDRGTCDHCREHHPCGEGQSHEAASRQEGGFGYGYGSRGGRCRGGCDRRRSRAWSWTCHRRISSSAGSDWHSGLWHSSSPTHRRGIAG